MNDIEAIQCMKLIDALRADEADSVTIGCDNPDFQGPNNYIECDGEWTQWRPRRFTGDSVLECLQKACGARGIVTAPFGPCDLRDAAMLIVRLMRRLPREDSVRDSAGDWLMRKGLNPSPLR